MSTRKAQAAVLSLLAALWPVLWFARVSAIGVVADALIPLFVVSVFASVVTWGQLGAARTTGLVRLSFGLIAAGDVFINLTPWPAASVPAFLAAHASLALAFAGERPFRGRALLVFAPAVLVTAAFARAHLPRLDGAGRSLVLLVYLAALLAMVWRALCSAERSIKGAARALGAVLFFATDLCTIAEVIEGARAYAGWIWAMYPPALIGLAWSCWGPRWRRAPSPGPTTTH